MNIEAEWLLALIAFPVIGYFFRTFTGNAINANNHSASMFIVVSPYFLSRSTSICKLLLTVTIMNATRYLPPYFCAIIKTSYNWSEAILAVKTLTFLALDHLLLSQLL